MIEREIERVREGFAKLEPVDRAAAEGDVLLIDFEGLLDGKAFEGGKADDYLLELGSGQLIEGFEEQLQGARPGESRQVEVSFPDDYQAEQLAGEDAVFAVEVKEVREKILPDLDDDFASEASEFDTLEELRADIRQKLTEVVDSRIEQDFRVAAIDAAAEQATVELPDQLVDDRAAERWGRVERQLAARGMSPDAYLQMQGKTREEVIEESKPDAERELRREAVLAAIVEAEEPRRDRGGAARGARPSRRARADDPGEAAEAPARQRPRRDGRRGHPLPQGDRPRRRERDSDPARAGRGAGEALDSGEGAGGGGIALDTGLGLRLSPRGRRSASIECKT